MGKEEKMKRKNFFRLMIIFCFVLLPFAKPVSAMSSPWTDDADFRFVDALGSTGYYIDVYSLNLFAPDECAARLAVVKADKNRMVIYTMVFNRKAQTYWIIKRVELEYDTKKELSVSDKHEIPVYYGAGTPIGNAVDFIYEYKR